jgi:hypothetical protein
MDNSMQALRSYSTRHRRNPETGDQIFTVSIDDGAGTETRIADITLYDEAFVCGTTCGPDGPCVVIHHENGFLEAFLGAMPPE